MRLEKLVCFVGENIHTTIKTSNCYSVETG